mgnify:CR=1 FL=1
MAEDFSLYLHAPTRTDPSVAPPGHDAFYALSPVPHLDSGTDWARVALGYQRRVLERIHAVMKPKGLLYVGHSENFSDSRELFRLRGKTIYERV